MKTYLQRINELYKEFTPKQRRIVKMDEIYFINKKLELDGLNELELHNMRDMAVMYFDLVTEDKVDLGMMDKMSAITSVIDLKLRNIGAQM